MDDPDFMPFGNEIGNGTIEELELNKQLENILLKQGFDEGKQFGSEFSFILYRPRIKTVGWTKHERLFRKYATSLENDDDRTDGEDPEDTKDSSATPAKKVWKEAHDPYGITLCALSPQKEIVSHITFTTMVPIEDFQFRHFTTRRGTAVPDDSQPFVEKSNVLKIICERTLYEFMDLELTHTMLHIIFSIVMSNWESLKIKWLFCQFRPAKSIRFGILNFLESYRFQELVMVRNKHGEVEYLEYPSNKEKLPVPAYPTHMERFYANPDQPIQDLEPPEELQEPPPIQAFGVPINDEYFIELLRKAQNKMDLFGFMHQIEVVTRQKEQMILDAEKQQSAMGVDGMDIGSKYPIGCHLCGDSIGDLMLCGSCERTFYCSEKCQRDDWRDHVRICTPISTS